MPTKPFTGSDDPRNGRGPKKGAPNAGRPTNAYRALCREAAEAGLRSLRSHGVMDDPTHPAFIPMLKLAITYAYGRPASAPEEPTPITSSQERDLENERLIAARASMHAKIRRFLTST